MECLRYFCTHCYRAKSIFTSTSRACYHAASGGHVTCLQLLNEQGCIGGQDVCHIAAQKGHLECLRYAHEHGCPWNACDVICIAADKSHISCFQYLVEEGCPLNSTVCDLVCSRGNLEMVHLAHKHGCVLTQKGLLVAARRGQLAVFEYLVQHGVQPTDKELEEAVMYGHEDIALFMLNQGCRATPQVWRVALNADMKRLLDEICELRALWPGRECQQAGIDALLLLAPEGNAAWKPDLTQAIAGGCLHCAQRLHKLGYRWEKKDYRFSRTDHVAMYKSEDFASYLAYNGFLDCLQFARAHGCSWDKRTCTAAALGGHIEVLQWAHEQGCSWDADETAQAAVVSGNAECMEYVLPLLKLLK